MTILGRLLGKKKSDAVDVDKGQVIGDAQEVLRICKNCQHYASISMDELRYYFARYRDGASMERLEKALKLLVRSGFVSWSGDQVGFSKNNLPLTLQQVKFE